MINLFSCPECLFLIVRYLLLQMLPDQILLFHQPLKFTNQILRILETLYRQYIMLLTSEQIFRNSCRLNRIANYQCRHAGGICCNCCMCPCPDKATALTDIALQFFTASIRNLYQSLCGFIFFIKPGKWLPVTTCGINAICISVCPIIHSISCS